MNAQQNPGTNKKPKAGKLTPIDVAAIHAAAQNLDGGTVTFGYQGNREKVIALLNSALATKLVCVMRYKRHYFTTSGIENSNIKAELLAHSQEEAHADMIAERIIQLNGRPAFNLKGIIDRSPAEYADSSDIKSMVRTNLIAKRSAIEMYRQMIEHIGDTFQLRVTCLLTSWQSKRSMTMTYAIYLVDKIIFLKKLQQKELPTLSPT